MSDLINISNHDGILTVSSRQVAEDFEKRHCDTLEVIDRLISQMNSTEKSVQYFIPTEYRDVSGKANKEYLLTRDGFSLLVMGFTGQKALEWKLKYIEAFNKMEDHIRNQQKPMCLEDVLIQSLQEMKAVKLQLSQISSTVIEAKHDAQEVKQELQTMRDVITLDTRSWRKDTSRLISKMAAKAGGYQHIEPIRAESYKLFCERLNVNLEIRLTNIKKEAALNGMTQSKLKKFNYLDAIEKDKRLIEGYVAIVKEMAVKYGVAESLEKSA